MEILERIAGRTQYQHKLECAIGILGALIQADDASAIDVFASYLPTTDSSMFDVTVSYEFSYICDESIERQIRDLARDDAVSYWIKNDVCFLRFCIGEFIVYVSDFDPITSQDYVIVSRRTQYWVICRAMTEMISRVSVRLFREVLLRQLENIGGCFAHSAAIVAKESMRGLLVFGDAGAGKSTTVWQLCRSLHFDYLSNDKSIVIKHEGRLKTLCWPLAVRLGVGALQASGKLDTYKKNGQTREQEASLWSQSVESLEQKRSNWGNKVKLSLTPRELHTYEGIQSKSCCLTVGTIVPSLRLGRGELRFEQVDFERNRALIERNILEPWDEDLGRGWLGVRTVSDDYLCGKKAELLDTLAGMPVYELSGDPEFFARSVDKIVATINAVVRAHSEEPQGNALWPVTAAG